MYFKNQVNFGHILSILAIVIIPLLIWGFSVEAMRKDVERNTNDITEIKSEAKEIKLQNTKNHNEVMDKLHEIELQLKDKKDRE
ncbi:hypothetical protein CL622_08555 [archaeon]|nr:hypothetical protein [archaeon]|tara:strand:+ start:477 stop:728 length:252 start_codon:yes stop_codon:yes gene_type:complete